MPPRASLPAQALGGLQAWALAHGVKAVRLWLGVVYFWFGALKFAPLVAADESYLPGRVVSVLTLGALDATGGTQVLAYWECLIGFCLVAGLWLRTASILMLAHMLIMFLPMVTMPKQVWDQFPFLLTIKGQLIVDNLVLIACGMMLASSVPRGPPRRILGRAGLWMRAWDDRATLWLGRHGILLLRVCLGTLYLWYGALKFAPGSHALDPLIAGTAEVLSGGALATTAGRVGLGAWECLIGAALLTGRAPRAALLLILLHLVASCIPLLATPEAIWVRYPFTPTLAGKFTMRHLALGSAALVVAASVAQRASGWSARVNPFLGAVVRPQDPASRNKER